jgi:hypothetical protein
MKNVVQEEEDNIIGNDINNFCLEYMELKVDIEKMFPTIDQPGNMDQKNSSLEIVGNETVVGKFPCRQENILLHSTPLLPRQKDENGH